VRPNNATDDFAELARRSRLRLAILVVALVATATLGVWYLQRAIPRQIVVASGVKTASYHLDAERYAAILARHGVTIKERMTGGAEENAALLLDPGSGVDVAFLEGGVMPASGRAQVEMLAALRYEPIWIFYRGSEPLTLIEELRYKRVAVGAPGNGGRVIVEPLLAASNVTSSNTRLLPIGGNEALRALQAGTIDADVIVGAPGSPIIWQALHDENLKLMSFADTDAYARRFPYITPLTLPAGTVDMGYRRIPAQPVRLIATKAMLVARDDLPPALVNLLLDAALELHSGQGFFESAGEFPSTAPVDLPVDPGADRHLRFGPNLLHRYLPFWGATFAERLIVVVLPLLVVFVPIFNFLPQVLRWRTRSRIYRWYGELKLLELDVERRTGALPIDKWLADLDRIDRAAEHVKIPASFASEAYTLREHVNLVRRAVLAKRDARTPPEAGAGGADDSRDRASAGVAIR
jgi:TRAP-type uncharacterized transport system substrate-binding protein